VRKSSKQVEQDKSKLQRVKDLPWALLLQMGLVLGKRWRSLSTKDRKRLTELTRESRGRLDNLSAKERRELKKLVGKLHPKRTARDLVLLTRARRRRKRR
jgi:mevalonate kinase